MFNRCLLLLGLMIISNNLSAFSSLLKKIELKSYQRDAQKGDRVAQFSLGSAYVSIGNEEGQRLAEEWYQRSAEQHYAPALFSLGLIYENKNNLIEALMFYERAKNLGYTLALLRMGIIHEQLEQFDQAFYCYSLASKRHIMEAKVRLGLILKKGRWLQESPENDHDALELFLAAADGGHAGGMYEAARMIDVGRGQVADQQKALKLYQAAALRKHDKALQIIRLRKPHKTYGFGGLAKPKNDHTISTEDLTGSISIDRFYVAEQ